MRKLSYKKKEEKMRNFKTNHFIWFLGFVAYLANGLSICYQFSMDIHAWLLGFVPAMFCFMLLLARKKIKHSWVSEFITLLCLLGVASLLMHLFLCEIWIVPVSNLDVILSIIYRLSCYAVSVASSLLLAPTYFSIKEVTKP